MKQIISKIKRIDLTKVWTLLFIAVFSWIISFSILNSNITYSFDPFFLVIFIVLILLLLIYSYRYCTKRWNSLSDKKTTKFLMIAMIIMTILQLIIGYLVRTNPSWDLGINMRAAREIVQYGHMVKETGYYLIAPNNILNALFLALIYKIGTIFHISMGNMMPLIANVLIMQLAFYFLFKVSRKIYGNVVTCMLAIFVLLFVPFYAYAPICYTDTLSMFLPILFLYLFLRENETPKKSNLNIKYYVLMGLCCLISFHLKVTALIMMIAIVIEWILSRGIKKTYRPILLIVIVFLTSNFIYISILDHSKVIGLNYKELQTVPYTHWIMMGMTEKGMYSQKEWDYTLSFPTRKSREQANISVIKQRLKDYGIQGYIKFLNNKATNSTWGDGTYDFPSILKSYTIDWNIMHEFFLSNGRYFELSKYYYQTYHFVMLICILFASISIFFKREKSEVRVARLSIFGLLIFLLIWETRSRYMLNYIPIYLFVGMAGLTYLSNQINYLSKIFFKEDNYDKKM